VAPDELAARFRHHLAEAMAWYREALRQDATYTPAAVNLGCALVLRGAQSASPLQQRSSTTSGAPYGMQASRGQPWTT
jgi:hypothetical protein